MERQSAIQTADLVQRAAEGDQRAWDELIVQYSGLLWSVARGFRLGEQQSADVVQTTWLRLVENIHLIRNPERLVSWLVVTARHLCVGAIRQAQRVQLCAYDPETGSWEESPEAAVLRSKQETLVREALRRLSSRDQQLLTLLVASPPVPYEEISRRLGMPVGSIGPTRKRALLRLRLELERSGVIEVDTL